MNATDPPSGNVVVNWYHEVLWMMTSATDTTYVPPAGSWTNYGSFGGDGTEPNNWHYFGESGACNLNNTCTQMLPLQFVNWAGGTKYKIVSKDSPFANETYTDVPGCHGTSGSGVFLTGTSTLLGPVIHGGTASAGRICDDMNNSALKNQQNMTYLDAPNALAIEAGSLVHGDK